MHHLQIFVIEGGVFHDANIRAIMTAINIEEGKDVF
jgi:hypothetical protein